MLRTLFWAVWLFGYLIVSLPVYWKVKRLAKKGRMQQRDALVARKVRGWAAALLRHIKMNVQMEGAENLPNAGEVAVFVANHQSYLDIPILLSCLKEPYPLMAKKELEKIPLLGAWMRQLGCVFVDRQDARASVAAMKQAEQALLAGKSFAVFPEGTRSRSGEIAEFKGGAVRMAYKTGVPVVPLAIDGSYRALEGNRWRLKKTDVRLVILPAVPTANLSREEQKQLPQKLEEMVRAAKDGTGRPAGQA